MLACALIAGVLLVAWVVLSSRVHDEIRCEIQRVFAEHYSQYHVSLRSAKLLEGRGVEIHDLIIADRQSGQRLVRIGEMFAECPIDVETLLSGNQPAADRIRIAGLELCARRTDDGAWNLQHLWPLPKFGSHQPPIEITDASLEITHQVDGSDRSLHFRHINAEAVPVQHDVAVGESARHHLEIRGVLQGDHVQALRFHARMEPRSGQWSIGGLVEGLQLSPQLHATLPVEVQDRAAALASINGQLDLQFTASSRIPEPMQEGDKSAAPSPSPPSEQSSPARGIVFSVTGALRDGQLVDARLPYPLYDLCADIELDERGFRLNNVFARNGASTIQMSVQRGWETDSPFALEVKARQLELENRFVEILPTDFQAIWRKYFPAGMIDADVRLDFDGARMSPEFLVQCRDVSFEYYKFPYRLETGRGTLRMKDDVLSVDMVASAGGQDVVIQGQLQHPQTDPTGWIDVRCDHPIPIDRKLLAAVIDPKAQAVIGSLRPRGSLAVSGRFERRGPTDADLSKSVTLQLINCTMKYDRFPYPLAMINGTCLWNDDGWFFRDLSGRNDSGYIECQGSWRKSNDGNSQLLLDFVGADVLLADELRDALSPGAQHLWNQLQPRGTVDHMTVAVAYASATRQLSLEIAAQKWQRQGRADGRSITVRPEWFPYRLDDLTGTLHYRDGQVRLQNISAMHGETEIGIGGTCELHPNGNWIVKLPHVAADRMRFDRELLEAIPSDLGAAIGKLNLAGNINLLGGLSFSGNSRNPEATTANWNVSLDIENGGIQCGLQLDHMHGEVGLNGASSSQGFYSRGELNFDSMFHRGAQLTQVQGPFYVDANGVVLGAGAEHNVVGRAPRTLTAQTIGGQLSVDAAIAFRADSPYHLQARLERVDLQQMSRELALKTEGIRGKANAVLNLRGNRHGWPSWRGDGAIRLYEADIYQIPAMLSLLSLLSVKRPDTNAFSSSEIDFRIQGEHLYLDRVNFNGDAISLKGHGEMNLDRRIDLKFYTLVGSGELPLPALRALLRQASRQMLLIQVTGTLEEPQFTKEPLPMLRDTLDQIFPEPTERERLSRLPPLTPSLPPR
jgi:hypothetical protein